MVKTKKGVLTATHKKWLESVEQKRDLVLSNLMLLGQIPAETFKEAERANFALERLNESEDIDGYLDEAGNVVGVLKGTNSKKKIVLSANLDTRFAQKIDHNILVNMDTAAGPGVANNSMGAAALLSIPDIIKSLKLEFESDLIFLASTKSLGRGDLVGMRHFFNTYPFGVDYVLNLAGTQIGRVDHFCQSAVRCDISCMVESPDEFSATGFGQDNAIIVLNELINSLLTIPISSRPKTSLNIGMIKGGKSYTSPCPLATLNIYVRSEDDAMTEKVMDAISDCCVDVGAKNGAQLDVSFFGRQRAAGMRFSEPLVKTAINTVEELGYKPKVAPSNTQIAVPLSLNIPSLTLGITKGKKSTLPEGYVELEPISKGLLQVLMIIEAIDKGLPNDKIN